MGSRVVRSLCLLPRMAWVGFTRGLVPLMALGFSRPGEKGLLRHVMIILA